MYPAVPPRLHLPAEQFVHRPAYAVPAVVVAGEEAAGGADLGEPRPHVVPHVLVAVRGVDEYEVERAVGVIAGRVGARLADGADVAVEAEPAEVVVERGPDAAAVA